MGEKKMNCTTKTKSIEKTDAKGSILLSVSHNYLSAFVLQRNKVDENLFLKIPMKN